MDSISFTEDDDNIENNSGDFKKQSMKFKKEQEKRWNSFFQKHSVHMDVDSVPSLGIYEVQNDLNEKSDENSSVEQFNDFIESKNNEEVTNLRKRIRKKRFPKKNPSVTDIGVNDFRVNVIENSLLEQSEDIIESESNETSQNIENFNKQMKQPQIISAGTIIGTDIFPVNVINNRDRNSRDKKSKKLIETAINGRGENVEVDNIRKKLFPKSPIRKSHTFGYSLSENMSKLKIQKVLVNFIEGKLNSRLGYYYVFLYSSCIRRDKNQDEWRDAFVKELLEVRKKVESNDLLTYIRRIFDPANPINRKALIDTIENKCKSELRFYFLQAYERNDEESWTNLREEWKRLSLYKDIPEKCLCIYHRQVFGVSVHM